MRCGSFIALSFLAVPTLGRHYIISNLCPSTINVYVAGRLLETIAYNYDASVDLSDDEEFYTDANRKSGSSNGTRVGFKLEKPYGYYYMVVDPNNFNVGVAIEAFSDVPDESCDTVYCSSALCTEAFNNNQEPTDSELNSLPTSISHLNPLHSCLFDDMTYTITYCPGPYETWPSDTHVLHPEGTYEGKFYCLDVQGAKFENGTPVQLYACNGTPAQQWVLNGFSTKVKLAGTNFCLDAGSNPGNGVGMKIWECYDNLPAQSWYYTEDNCLALEGQGLCLDLANGMNGNGSFVQTWQCTDNDINQIWKDYWVLSG